MRYKIEFTRGSRIGRLLSFLVGGVLVSAAPLNAQHPGNSTYYSSTCSSSCSSAVSGSGVYIDASQFGGTSVFCVKVNDALNAIPSGVTGAVVDARGINPGGTNTCSTDPFSGITNGSVLLLPSGTISISASWVIPAATKIIGEGSGLTTIEDAVGLNPMLQMGPSTCSTSSPCMGITIEELSLNGQYLATTGILNQGAEEHSYVRNVAISEILGTGLVVESDTAGNSGPYENLYIAAGTSNTSTANQCVAFGGSGSNAGPPGTRGIHGLTCIGNGHASTGIDLNASNTTVEDLSISGFTNGIVVGDLATSSNPVQSEVLINITAASGAGTMTNLIQLSNAGNCTSIGGSCTAIGTNVTDIDMLAVTNTVATNTINDQLTNTTITHSQAGQVAMYALGQPLNATNSLTQNSLFTTIPSLPSWATGSTSISSGSSCTSLGSLYSNITGTASGSDNLYACIPASASTKAWTAIK